MKRAALRLQKAEGGIMEPIQAKSLRERVIHALRTAIVNGELMPGQALVGADLASQMGVSQATLREAIYALSIEGLVETAAYHVSRVKQLSKKDIEDLFSVRSLLETYAIRQIAATGQTAAAVSELYAVCDEMKQAAKHNSLIGINRSDRKFHDLLIQHSGNQLLEVLWSSVAQRVQQVMSLSNRKQGNLPQIARNHRQIAQVIENEDVGEAVRLLNDHIKFIADEIADSWHIAGQPQASDVNHQKE